MKTFYFILIYISIISSLLSVSGLSSTKLVIPSAIALEQGIYEFDMNFYWLKSSDFFSEKGQTKPFSLECDGICKRNKIYGGGFTFRLTYGIENDMEIGFEAGNQNLKEEVYDFTFSYMDDIKLGYKWNILNQDTLLFSFQMGNTYDYQSFTPLYEGGILISKEGNDFSIDFDFHYFTTKRLLVQDQDKIEQETWYFGPHFGVGMGYNFNHFTFSVEYHYEEGKTRVKKYEALLNNGFEQRYIIQKYLGLENLNWNTILGLPETIQIDNLILPTVRFYEHSKHYLITKTLYYGFSYSISEHSSVSLIIQKIVGGRNVNHEQIVSLVTTFRGL